MNVLCIAQDNNSPRTAKAACHTMKSDNAVEWAWAILLSAGVSVAIGLLLIPLPPILPIVIVAFVISLGFTTFCGLPLVLIFREKQWTRPVTAITVGFLVGSILGGPTVAQLLMGSPGLVGWGPYLWVTAATGIAGAAGACCFWYMLSRSNLLKPTDTTPPDEETS